MEGLYWAFRLLVIYYERYSAQILVVVVTSSGVNHNQVDYHRDVNECVEVCEKAAKTPTPAYSQIDFTDGGKGARH